ncbi:ATP-dependent DNA helicase [Cognatilysobacter bugurensis]|uniref:ATP-dependent DNA helicase n=1 Tax=Cognatilysobacter bugurensis TaxID=543356 RepID=UPI001E3A3CDF|nr:ATP-dependent RecD-like DNA helicase [Lysobacter bugurensis]
MRDKFGDALPSILDAGDRAKLLEAITPKKADAILKHWHFRRSHRTLEALLGEWGLPNVSADRALALWGPSAGSVLSADLYKLLAVASWREVDAAALRAGVLRDAPRRLTAACEAAAYMSLERSGATLISEPHLRLGVEGLLGSAELAAAALASALDAGAILRLGNAYQVPGAYYAEREVEAWVVAKVAEPGRKRAVCVEDRVLTPAQRQAVRNALTLPLSLFHGPAGTGKTYIAKAICQGAVEQGETPVLIAVAARAARRLAEASGHEAMTLARAQKILASRSGSSMLLIIDEFSMVDLLDFRNLIRRIPATARVVLCGDVAQLPSIGPGRLIHSFVRSGIVACTELVDSQRQAIGGQLRLAVEALRAGCLPPFRAGSGTASEDFDVISGSEGELARLAKARYSELPHPQIITPFAKGQLGSRRINLDIHLRETGGTGPSPGAPVVFTKNVVTALGFNVLNGQQGLVEIVWPHKPNRPLAPVVRIRSGLEIIELTQSDWDCYVEFGYALTIHRAQGGEWDSVIALLPMSPFIDRSMVYTAVSRARKRCIVLASSVGWLREVVAKPPVVASRLDGLFFRRAQ